ncbi:hypothetical protein BDR22DRAFT_977996 [Usnea florida]
MSSVVEQSISVNMCEERGTIMSMRAATKILGFVSIANPCNDRVPADLVIVGFVTELETMGYLGHEHAGLDLRDLSPILAMDTLNHRISTIAQLVWPGILIFDLCSFIGVAFKIVVRGLDQP